LQTLKQNPHRLAQTFTGINIKFGDHKWVTL
jgi:hypothetical protein